MKEIVFAGGCFWGVEAYMSKIEGVENTEVGYANGKTENPTYEEVCKGKTGYAEACYVKYNKDIISLGELVEKFWKIIDPTVLNRQANDIGNQYRTGIYYIEQSDLKTLESSLVEEQKKYDKKIVTEIEHLKNFCKAEEYHQDYLVKNPDGYCHIQF